MIGIQSVGSVSIIKAKNALIGECITHCRNSIDECLASRRPFIVLDLSESPLIDSEGLEFILDVQKLCLSRGGRLVVAAAQPLCEEVLQITGVDDCVAVFKDLRAALSDFAR